MRFVSVVPTLVVFATACATGDLPARTASDPANPAAKEGVPFSLATPAGDASSAHEHHDHGTSADAATVYTCPMHPEVVQDRPGTCPKCGMTLKPK